MKLTFEIKETPQGHVTVDAKSEGMAEGTLKEKFYVLSLNNLAKLALPKLCESAGGLGAITGLGDPENG